MSDSVIQMRGTIYENGYGLIAQKVMRDRDLSPIAKSIYSYICSFAGVGKDGERTAFPGVALMKEELGIKTNGAYYKHRNQLIEKGYLTIEKQRQEGQRFDNNLYFIEAVPVEITKEEKPQSEKQTKGEPWSVSPTTVSPTTVKQTTNITRSTITRFKEEEELIKENACYEVLADFFKEKRIDLETTAKTIQGLHQKGIDIFTYEDMKKQYKHIMKKMENEPIYDFSVYFVNGLERRVTLSLAKQHSNKEEAAEQEIQKQEREERKKYYYNWLEDQEG